MNTTICSFRSISAMTISGLLLIILTGITLNVSAQGCSNTLEYDHEFSGNSPPLIGSSAQLMLRLSDQKFRLIANSGRVGEQSIDTGTVDASPYNCFKGAQLVDCCTQGVERVIFSGGGGGAARVLGNILLTSCPRGVVDVVTSSGRTRYLLRSCASTKLISGGLGKYQTPFDQVVFRRMDKTQPPKLSIPADQVQLSAGAQLFVDIFKEGDAKKVARVPLVKSGDGKSYGATWDWTNLRGWTKPEQFPVGRYTVGAVSVAAGKENAIDKRCDFYLIFHKPEKLTKAEEEAYLYDAKTVGKRDENSIFYYDDNFLETTRLPVGNIVYKESVERQAELDPFSATLFERGIAATDGMTSEKAALGRLSTAVDNTIKYERPNLRRISEIYRGTSVEDFKKAANGTLIDKIKGQCMDYATALVAFSRSVGIPARDAHAVIARVPGMRDWAFHVWSEVYLNQTEAQADPWYVFDALLKKDASRKDFDQGGKRSVDIAVGNTEWIDDNGKLTPDKTVLKLHKDNNAQDALLEKCDNKKYNTEGCPAAKVQALPQVESMQLVDVDVAQDNYLVGAEVFVTVSVTNTEPVARTLFRATRIARVKAGDDGKSIGGLPEEGIPATGELGETLLRAGENILVPPGGTVTRTYSIIVQDTAYPDDRYIATATLKESEGADTILAEDEDPFEVHPWFTVNVAMPTTPVTPSDPFGFIATLVNTGLSVLPHVDMKLEIPTNYDPIRPLNVHIDALAAGESREEQFKIEPVEIRRAADVPMYLTITSDGGGSLRMNLAQTLELPVQLSLPGVIVENVPVGSPFPVRFSLSNTGTVPASDLIVRLSRSVDAPPDVIIEPATVQVPRLDGQESIEIETTVTTSRSDEFHLEVKAEDSEDHSANTMIRVIPAK